MQFGNTSRRFARRAFAGVFALSFVSHARAQETIWSTYGGSSYSYFGSGFDYFGDFDGDGIGDFVVGEQGGLLGKYDGCVKILSGADGSELSSINGAHAHDEFGASVATVGDLDLDGVPDYVVGAPGVVVQGVGGAVDAISGATGSVLYEINGSNGGDGIGLSVAAIGDVDGDAIGDFAAGSYHGYALMVSGATGTVLAKLSCSVPSGPIVVAGGGDLDGDGVPDVAVGDLGSSLGSKAGGALSLFSGATGATLYEIGYPGPASYFGIASFTEDVDGDGTADLIVGAPYDCTFATNGGSAWVYSGRSGTLIRSFAPSGPLAAWSNWGSDVHSAGDANGDGVVDWLISAEGFQGTSRMYHGTVFLMSGSDGAMLYHFEEPQTGGYSGVTILRPRDVDGDGVADFAFAPSLEFTSTLDYCGEVAIRKGHPLWVDAFLRYTAVNTSVTLSIGQALPAAPYALVLRGFDHTPWFAPIAYGFLDAAGRASFSGVVPTSLKSSTIDFQAFTLDAQGKLIASGVETLKIW